MLSLPEHPFRLKTVVKLSKNLTRLLTDNGLFDDLLLHQLTFHHLFFCQPVLTPRAFVKDSLHYCWFRKQRGGFAAKSRMFVMSQNSMPNFMPKTGRIDIRSLFK